MTTDSIREGQATRTDGAVSVPTKLRAISGLDPELVAKLAELDIVDNGTLLARGAYPAGREEITTATGINAMTLLTALYWMDLERVDGVAWTNANLLTAAGVTTVPDLAFRNAEDLLAQLQRANNELNLVKRLPTLKALNGWIQHAKSLPQVIFFGGNSEVY